MAVLGALRRPDVVRPRRPRPRHPPVPHRAPPRGDPLSAVTAEIARAWGLECTCCRSPTTRCAPWSTVDPEGEMGFQEYFVRRGSTTWRCSAVRFEGADVARARARGARGHRRRRPGRRSPRPTRSCRSARCWPCPASARRSPPAGADTVAVSPIVAGAALKGPADRLLRELGHEAIGRRGRPRSTPTLAATLVDRRGRRRPGRRVERGRHGLRRSPTPSCPTAERAAALARGRAGMSAEAESCAITLEVLGVAGMPEVAPGDRPGRPHRRRLRRRAGHRAARRRRGGGHPEGRLQGRGPPRGRRPRRSSLAQAAGRARVGARSCGAAAT